MLREDMEMYLPESWTSMDISEEYNIVEVPPLSKEFLEVEKQVSGSYCAKVFGIYRLQNPFLYTKFLLREYEYHARGHYDIKTLFHDTPSVNVGSISKFNLDWRFGERSRQGHGVYFSISPYLANRHSGKRDENLRSMFLVSVLTQNVQEVEGNVFLPDYGHDTVVCNKGMTYVKYFDNEYYPRYFVDYLSKK